MKAGIGKYIPAFFIKTFHPSMESLSLRNFRAVSI